MAMPADPQAPSLRIDPGRAGSIAFSFDGRPIAARAGESIAAALWRAGLRTLRASPVAGAPRGVFCAIGVCQECAVLIDGARRASCVTPARAGLQVRSISEPATEPGR